MPKRCLIFRKPHKFGAAAVNIFRQLNEFNIHFELTLSLQRQNELFNGVHVGCFKHALSDGYLLIGHGHAAVKSSYVTVGMFGQRFPDG